jgi:hypothetical protein
MWRRSRRKWRDGRGLEGLPDRHHPLVYNLALLPLPTTLPLSLPRAPISLQLQLDDHQIIFNFEHHHAASHCMNLFHKRLCPRQLKTNIKKKSFYLLVVRCGLLLRQAQKSISAGYGGTRACPGGRRRKWISSVASWSPASLMTSLPIPFLPALVGTWRCAAACYESGHRKCSPPLLPFLDQPSGMPTGNTLGIAGILMAALICFVYMEVMPVPLFDV